MQQGRIKPNHRMLRSGALLPAVFLACVLAAGSQTPAALTNLRAIHTLSNEQASHHLPVAFEATVIYFRASERTLFVQDGDSAVYIVPPSGEMRLQPGDRILIKGATRESFRPYIASTSITLLRHEALPKAVRASFDDMIHARYDCRLVTVRGVVLNADALSSEASNSFLQLRTDGGSIDVTINSNDVEGLRKLLDSEVEVTGAGSGNFDGKMQQTGVLIHVASLADVKVLHSATAGPWALPVTPMNEILNGYHVQNLTPRIHVRGTITYYDPGAAIVLQDGAKSLWIMTYTRSNLHIGNVADATGIPDVHDGFLALSHAEVQESQVRAPVAPQPASWNDLTLSHSIFDLVSIEGQVVMEVREAAQDEYVLVADGHLFSAIIRHPATLNSALSESQLPPMKQIPLGARIRVTGICLLQDSNPFDSQVPFNILMRTADDATVIAGPPWLNIRTLTELIILLLLVIIVSAGWALMLMRKVNRQSSSIAARNEEEAALERRRSRILEDINGARSLAEIIEQIAELVSTKLGGAPCWCQIADGACLGACPREQDGLMPGGNVVAMEITGRSGTTLGVLFAGLSGRCNETEALAVGAGLAALAIETKRLFSDLLHRSEFDQLTEIHNRFSLEKHLDLLIEDARINASVFGLIYIDLDKFKQINDNFGHHAGDLYLQQVAKRMKTQMRGADMLARLGGDEFAVLVPVVRNRSDVEEIAVRLQHCFDAPFIVDEHQLYGAASIGIAFYPDDGATKDDLQSFADAAMYAIKHSRRKSPLSAAAHR